MTKKKNVNRLVEEPKPFSKRFDGIVSTTILGAAQRMNPTLIPKKNLAMTIVRN